MQKVKTMIQQLQYSIDGDETAQKIKIHEPEEEKTKSAEELAEEA